MLGQCGSIGVMAKPGPYRDIKQDRKILKLRQQGLTFRQIARVMDRDVKTVFERHQKAVWEDVIIQPRRAIGRKEQSTKRSSFYKLEVLTHYGGNPPRCSSCGEGNLSVLEVDHINNDGKSHKNKGGGRITGSSFYRYILNNSFPGGLQVLCKNCNWLKYLDSKGKIGVGKLSPS